MIDALRVRDIYCYAVDHCGGDDAKFSEVFCSFFAEPKPLVGVAYYDAALAASSPEGWMKMGSWWGELGSRLTLRDLR